VPVLIESVLNGFEEGNNNTNNFTDPYSFPILNTKYVQRTVNLIGVLEKNFVLIGWEIFALGLLSISHIPQVQSHIHILISDNDYNITVLCLYPQHCFFLNQGEFLNLGMFDGNSIKATMNIAIDCKSKE
jgi:hypothetical protein